MRWKNWGELRIDEFSRRRLIENQDTVNELTAGIQELQNEVNCMSDSRDCKDAESVRSQAVLWECRAATMGRQRFGIRMGDRETFFANPRASSSSLVPGELNPWISHVTEDTLVRTNTGDPLHVMNVRFQTQSWIRNFRRDRQPEIHSTPREGIFSKNYEADQQRLQIFTLTNSLL